MRGFGRLNTYHASVAQPRAAIVAPASMSLWFDKDLSSADVATCLWKTGELNCPEIYVVAVYCDITADLDKYIPDNMQKVVRKCLLRQKPIILSIDSNAHSEWWGLETNDRGVMVEEFILTNSLRLENIGKPVTFIGRGTETRIDITLSSEIEIEGWSVNPDTIFSDHLMIEYEIMIKPRPMVMRQPIPEEPEKWIEFRENLPNSWGDQPQAWSRETIDSRAENITTKIKRALAATCKPRPEVNKQKKANFWNEELDALRTQVKRAYKKATKTKTNEDWDCFKAERNSFKNMLRSVKKKTWQEHCEGTIDVKAMAKLTKAINGSENKSVGLLTMKRGNQAANPEESMNGLLDVHFPGSVNELAESDENHSETMEWSLVQEEAKFITKQKVKQAIATFGPQKAAGTDGIKPVILQNLDEETLEELTNVMRACLALGYTPEIWRWSKVIFLPKPGKEDYTAPKSFRPISLTSFMLKAMERVVMWELERVTLKEHPLNPAQHGFRKGSSCESAIMDLVNDIESSTLRGGYALGVFLDIQGAFDNLRPESAIRGMEAKSFPPNVVKWYGQYLVSRKITVDIKGVKMNRSITKGTPQGGVLSPLMWNLAFDSLLELYETGPVRVRGFADDACLVITGKVPWEMQRIMQEAVSKAAEWGDQNGLTFGPAKTVPVIFTRKRKLAGGQPPKLVLKGKEVEYQNSAKYLGVILDTTLSYKEHIREKLGNARRLLMAVKNAVGKLWGPKPWLMKWAYTGMVRPMITYGAIAWGLKANSLTNIKAFKKIQRLAMMGSGPFRQSTPTAGLEVVFDIPPLELHIEAEGIVTLERIKGRNPERWDGIGHGKTRSTIRSWYQAKVDWGLKGVEVEKVNLEMHWDNNFVVDVGNKEGSGQDHEEGAVCCFTDGSKLDNKTGWGYTVRKDDMELAQCYGSLPDSNTVFQAEVEAIKQACDAVQADWGDSVYFYVDSQAALLAVNKYTSKTKQVRETICKLNALGETKTVQLKWIKAHVGTIGNERADELAKCGTYGDPNDQAVPLPSSLYRTLVRGTLRT